VAAAPVAEGRRYFEKLAKRDLHAELLFGSKYASRLT
jgi:hypothetical protein